MDDRIIEFVRGMRAAGVRVSMAESMDAMRAVEALGVSDKDLFRHSLRATLVKESDDFPVFEELFPLYFSHGGPPLQNALEDLSEDEQEMLKAALQALSGRLQRLLDWLTSGEGPTKEELEQLAERAGVQWRTNPNEAQWVTRRMLQQMGMAHLEDQLRELMQRLSEMGMSREAIEKLMGVVEANREALTEQIARQVGHQIAEQRANRPDELYGSDLMHKPFENLTDEEANMLRREVQRLVAQLRSRAALRRKRGKDGRFDSKGTIRANQRYGGVPMELKFKRKKLKPSLVLICDISRSMLPVAEFMLRLTYELQDQVSKTSSFGFYGDMEEISPALTGNRPADAVDEVMKQFYGRAPQHYYTNLGNSLDTFFHNWLGCINSRTTVVILGDGRNNFHDPRTDLIKDLQHRSRRLIWFNPEPPHKWDEGDSDMLLYAPLCDQVHIVRNLAQLSAAVDKLMAGA
ncbi:MAG TPA: VWA domain-containing protein [Promineifilum sp.]